MTVPSDQNSQRNSPRPRSVQAAATRTAGPWSGDEAEDLPVLLRVPWLTESAPDLSIDRMESSRPIGVRGTSDQPAAIEPAPLAAEPESTHPRANHSPSLPAQRSSAPARQRWNDGPTPPMHGIVQPRGQLASAIAAPPRGNLPLTIAPPVAAPFGIPAQPKPSPIQPVLPATKPLPTSVQPASPSGRSGGLPSQDVLASDRAVAGRENPTQRWKPGTISEPHDAASAAPTNLAPPNGPLASVPPNRESSLGHERSSFSEAPPSTIAGTPPTPTPVPSAIARWLPVHALRLAIKPLHGLFLRRGFDRIGARIIVGLAVAAIGTIIFLMTRPDPLLGQRIARDADESPIRTDSLDRTAELTRQLDETGEAQGAPHATATPRTVAPPDEPIAEPADRAPRGTDSTRTSVPPLTGPADPAEPLGESPSDPSLPSAAEDEKPAPWRRDDLGQRTYPPSESAREPAPPEYPQTTAPSAPIDWKLIAQQALLEIGPTGGASNGSSNVAGVAESVQEGGIGGTMGLRSGPLQLSPVATPPPDWNTPPVPQTVISPLAPRTASGEPLIPQPGPSGQYFYRNPSDGSSLNELDRELFDQGGPQRAAQMPPSPNGTPSASYR